MFQYKAVIPVILIGECVQWRRIG